MLSFSSLQYTTLHLICMSGGEKCVTQKCTDRIVQYEDWIFWFYCFFFPPIVLQRLNEARRMMDKLRACIVANYYANAGMTRLPEVYSHHSRLLSAALRHWYDRLAVTAIFLCLPACFQEWPRRAEPSSHPPVPGVPVPFLFPPQPGLRDPFSGPLGVRIPLTARGGSREGWRGSVERGWQQAGAQTRTQHRKSELNWQTGWDQ